MKTSQVLTDKLSIGLSLACTIHCLVLPILLISLPSLAALNIHDESFHLWMVIAVIPTSLYALSLGCKQHKRYQLFYMGIIGLTLLLSALLLGEERIGEVGEKILTVAGSVFLAVGHWFNFRLCQKNDHKNCSPSKDMHSDG